MMHTRRTFLATAGLTLGGLGLGARTLFAKSLGARAANTFFDEPNVKDLLHTLAACAVDTARRSGASYADVRVARQYELMVGLTPNGIPVVDLVSTLSYGIRVIVHGALAFTYGNVPTVDAVVATARDAVAQAQGFARLVLEPVEMAPAPVVIGEWTTPYKIDPFAVPIAEQGDLLAALQTPAKYIEGGGSGARSGGTGLRWERETRVCATSEGSVTTQTFQRARHDIGVGVTWLTGASLVLPGLCPQHAGYEMIADLGLLERIKAFTEQIKAYAELPPKVIDVGRYPLVLDGRAMAMMLAHTLGPALHLDRVLGDEADASGTSILSPPQDVLGTAMFSPNLSVVAGRPRENLSGVAWDDECVAPDVFPVITDGHVVDYLSDRRTVPAVASWYARQGKPMRARGYAVASHADRPLAIGPGHLTLTPASAPMSLDDLCRDIKRGLLVLGTRMVSTDQQLASGLVPATECLVLELNNGRVVSHVKGIGMQFKTRTFWKNLFAVGDASTVAPVATEVRKGQPWQRMFADALAPAGAISMVDVVALGA